MVEQQIKALLPGILENVVLGELPSTPSNAVAIMLYSGVSTEEYFASGTVGKPVIKIVIRNSSYELAREYTERIRESLHRYHDDYFASILMQGYPMYLGKDEQKLHEFQIVFNISVKE